MKINNIIEVIKGYKIPPLSVLRRFAIGCLIGFIVIVLISSLPDNDGYSTQTPARQKFSIANLFQQKQETDVQIRSAFEFFSRNKQPLSVEQQSAIKGDAPRFSLIITNFGNNMALVDMLGEKLNAPVTLGIQSNIETYNPTAATLRELGYEIWLNVQTVTLEPQSDNGQHALNPMRDFDFNIAQLERQMGVKSSTTGIVIDYASLVPQSSDLWLKLTRDIFAQGYGVFDATPTPVATDMNYYNDAYAPYIKGNIALNTDAPIETIQQQLDAIGTVIQKNKNAIVTTNIYTPAALDIIGRWVNSLTANGVVMIPLSAQTNL